MIIVLQAIEEEAYFCNTSRTPNLYLWEVKLLDLGPCIFLKGYLLEV